MYGLRTQGNIHMSLIAVVHMYLLNLLQAMDDLGSDFICFENKFTEGEEEEEEEDVDEEGEWDGREHTRFILLSMAEYVLLLSMAVG